MTLQMNLRILQEPPLTATNGSTKNAALLDRLRPTALLDACLVVGWLVINGKCDFCGHFYVVSKFSFNAMHSDLAEVLPGKGKMFLLQSWPPVVPGRRKEFLKTVRSFLDSSSVQLNLSVKMHMSLRPCLYGEKLSPVEGSLVYPSYPGRANCSYISLQNLANRLHEKQKVGSAGRVTRLAGSPFFDGRFTFLAGPALTEQFIV